MGQEESKPPLAEFIDNLKANDRMKTEVVQLFSQEIPASSPGLALDHISFVTYNVWFSSHKFDTRVRALLNILKEESADIVCLQEVTPGFLTLLSKDKALCALYDFDFIKDKTSGYFVMAMFKKQLRPFVQKVFELKLPTKMGRSCVCVTLHVNGKVMTVGTSHLESMAHNTPLRKVQLNAIFSALKDSDTAIIMGDFNFCSTWEENSNIDSLYTDMWPALHSDDPGWTESSHTNTMMYEQKQRHKAVRFDRVLVRSNSWKPKEIKVLGTTPIDKDGDTWPSDHFGLKSVLEYKEEEEALAKE